jgi:hypothetical protein
VEQQPPTLENALGGVLALLIIAFLVVAADAEMQVSAKLALPAPSPRPATLRQTTMQHVKRTALWLRSLLPAALRAKSA